MQFAKLKQSAAAVLAASLFFAAPAAFAKLIWQDFSVSYLRGSNYDPQNNPVTGVKGQSEKREVVTFEHASGHDWGSTFLFVDRLMGRDDNYTNDAMYGEFSVNPKIGSNVFASLQMEFGSGDNGATGGGGTTASQGNSFNNFLIGPGFSLKIPGASFFNIMLYKRFNDQQALDARIPPSIGGAPAGRVRPNNEQLTATWRFDLFDSRLRFDGFMDYATGFHFKENRGMTARSHSSTNFTPQIKFDVGRELGWQPKKFWVGMEYVYWVNKFGVDNWDEKNPNFLLKWHF